jgi:hypothetical protein
MPEWQLYGAVTTGWFWPGAAVPNNRRKRTMGKMGGLMQVRFEARRLMSAPGQNPTLATLL